MASFLRPRSPAAALVGPRSAPTLAPGGPRRPLLAVLALLVGLAVTLVAGEPAHAHTDGSGPATPANAGHGGHWWASNGCGSVGTTWVPDRVDGTFDFHHSCSHPDG